MVRTGQCASPKKTGPASPCQVWPTVAGNKTGVWGWLHQFGLTEFGPFNAGSARQYLTLLLAVFRKLCLKVRLHEFGSVPPEGNDIQRGNAAMGIARNVMR